MNHMRYIIMMVMCLTWHITAFGQSDFNPTSPQEPDLPQLKHKLTLVALPGDGGSVSGGGTFVDGSKVTLRANASTDYTFEAWSDKDGIVLSTESSFQYTTKSEHETLYAHFRFTPASPNEPSEPSTTLYYQLSVEADQGCSVSGGGRYLAGKSIYVSANVESGYDFVNWTNANGEVVSTSRSFNYTKLAENEALTAHCRFNPSSPFEPSEPILKYNVTATCSEGGYYNGSTGRFLEGTSNTLYAYPNDGYDFVGWYLNGDFYTALPSFSYTVGKGDLDFYAKFTFNPSSPKEPLMPDFTKYGFYLGNVRCQPGEVIDFPIYLNNTELVKDVNIRITFPARMEVNPRDFILADNAYDYSVTIAEATDTISIIEEGARLWDFTLVGGELAPGNRALLTFKVQIPDYMVFAKHPVKINQVSLTKADGTTVTTSTKNGFVDVYRDVTISDITDLINVYLQADEVTDLPKYDIDRNGVVTIDDITALIAMYLKLQ